MTSGNDWLWRPVVRGMCQAESLYDGTFGLDEIAEMNEALEADDENRFRATLASRRANGN